MAPGRWHRNCRLDLSFNSEFRFGSLVKKLKSKRNRNQKKFCQFENIELLVTMKKELGNWKINLYQAIYSRTHHIGNKYRFHMIGLKYMGANMFSSIILFIFAFNQFFVLVVRYWSVHIFLPLNHFLHCSFVCLFIHIYVIWLAVSIFKLFD